MKEHVKSSNTAKLWQWVLGGLNIALPATPTDTFLLQSSNKICGEHILGGRREGLLVSKLYGIVNLVMAQEQ